MHSGLTRTPKVESSVKSRTGHRKLGVVWQVGRADSVSLNFVCPFWNRSRETSLTLNFHLPSGLTRTPKVESSVTSRTGWLLWQVVGPCASFEIGVEKPLSDWISCAPFEINFHMHSGLTRTPKVESSVTSRTGWLWRAVGPCASFEIGVEKPLSDWISCAPFEIGVEKPLLHSIFTCTRA